MTSLNYKNNKDLKKIETDYKNNKDLNKIEIDYGNNEDNIDIETNYSNNKNSIFLELICCNLLLSFFYLVNDPDLSNDIVNMAKFNIMQLVHLLTLWLLALVF